MSPDATARPPDSLQGAVFHPRSHDELLTVMTWAYDYRGDVTLELASRESICGYVFNQVTDGADVCVELFRSDNPAPLKISCRDIQGIRFSGEDTASGKSWEAWMQKKWEGGTP